MKRILYTLLGMMLSVGAWADNVAKIGDAEYESISAAITAVSSDQTITLLSDVTVSSSDEIAVTKKFTLDLAGRTITSTVSQPIYVGTTGDLTITGNGKIVGPVGEEGKALDGKSIITVEGGKLTYLNGTLTCGGVGSDGMYGVYILNGGSAIFGDEATQTGPTITSWFAAIGENNTTAPANITVYGGSYTAQANPSESDWWYYFCAPIYAAGSGEINISGGEFKGYYGLSSRYSNVNQVLNITGGTFEGSKSALFIGDVMGSESSATRDIAVSGGTFSSAVPEEYCADNFIPQDNGNGTFGVKTGSYVAKIGDVKYASLVDAFQAATEGQAITLLSDVTVSSSDEIAVTKKLTLDLAGYTITSTVSQPIYVGTTGDLTITGNGTIAGPTGEEGKALDGKAIITVEGGKLTYLNGSLTCGGVGSDGMYGVYILNGGTAVFGEEAGKTGPTITSWFAAIGENNTTAPANITVYGGSYTAQASPSESDWWHYFCAPIYAAGSGEINISGGEFKGYYGISSRYSNVNQDLNITGGTFNGSKSALFVDNQSGVASTATRDIAVSGGTFSSAVPEEYCAAGFIPTDNGDGNYGVKADTFVAKIGDAGYESLAGAIAAATSTDTITLLADATIETINVVEGKTIDKNGHEITVNKFNVIDFEACNVPFDFKANTASYTREIGTNFWGTVCVPFNLKSCDAYTLYNVTNIDGDKLNVTEVTDAAPGTPVIFKAKVSGTIEFSTTDADVKNVTLATVGTLVGTYSETKITSGLPGNIYFINGNKFHQAQVSLTVPAYRAYINNGASGAKPRVLSIVVDDEATAIETLDTNAEITAIYDINGRKLNAPQKGLNIMKLSNGKTAKLFVK